MNIEWCKNCELPNTRPNLFLDKFGICNACNIKLEKKNEKYFKPLGKKKFEKTVRNILKNNPKNNYDCLIQPLKLANVLKNKEDNCEIHQSYYSI